MLLCLLGEVGSYLFYSKQHIFPHKEHKEERENETPAQVFSCKFFKIFKNTVFQELLWWLLLKINTTNPNYCT